jgi:hypothetical protein
MGCAASISAASRSTAGRSRRPFIVAKATRVVWCVLWLCAESVEGAFELRLVREGVRMDAAFRSIRVAISAASNEVLVGGEVCSMARLGVARVERNAG